jgi:hypothetical protein
MPHKVVLLMFEYATMAFLADLGDMGAVVALFWRAGARDSTGKGGGVRWWTSLVSMRMACGPGMGVGEVDGDAGGVAG